MKQIARVGAAAIKSRLLFPAACLILALVPVSAVAVPGQRSLPQTVITYGFLRWNYVDLDRLFASDQRFPVIQDLQKLDTALKSLDCDVPARLAMPHAALILPPFPKNVWFGFQRIGVRNSPDRGWLFVTEPTERDSQRVLVVVSSASPERTTVFWLRDTGTGYATQLLYDSLKKGRVTNAATIMGAATEVKIENAGNVLLKDWGEPGVGPREFARIGRIFRLEPSQRTVLLVSPGIPVRRFQAAQPCPGERSGPH